MASIISYAEASSRMSGYLESLNGIIRNMSTVIYQFIASKMTTAGGSNIKADIRKLIKDYPLEVQVEILAGALEQLGNNPPMSNSNPVSTAKSTKKPARGSWMK